MLSSRRLLLTLRVAVAFVLGGLAAYATAQAVTGHRCAGAEDCPWSSVTAYGGMTLGSVAEPDYVVANDSRVYVADPFTYRVTEYTTNGSPVTSWGSKGTLPGQFNWISSIALAPDGDVYVANLYDEIEVFDANGDYLESITFTSPTASSSAWFSAMAFGPNGNLYIADGQADRIIEADPDGTPIRAFGSSGTGGGQFSYPRAIAIAGDGTVYVADGENNDVERFSATGTFLGSFGSLGQLDDPFGLAVAQDGSLLVSEWGAGRVSRWTSAGQYLASYTPAGGSEDFSPYGIATTPTGFLVVNMKTESVLGFTTSGIPTGTWASHTNDDLASANDIAIDPAHGWGYVVDETFQRVERINLQSGAISPTGIFGTAPVAVTVGPGGEVAVADGAHGDIDLYESGGTGFMRSIPLAEGEYIAGIAWGAGGDIYVLGNFTSTVTELTPSGATVRTFGGGIDDGVGHLAYPSAIAADPDGSLWVVDQGNGRIAHFSASGQWLGSFSMKGINGFANGLSVAPDGRLAVVDSDDVTIENPDGTLVAKWGGEGTGLGEFENATSGAWENEDTIWTAEYGSGRLQRFVLASPMTTTTTPTTTTPAKTTPTQTTPTTTTPTTSTPTTSTTTPTSPTTPTDTSTSNSASGSNSNASVTVALTTPAVSPPSPSPANSATPTPAVTPAARGIQDEFAPAGRTALHAQRFRLIVGPDATVTLYCRRHDCRKTVAHYATGGSIDLASALPWKLVLGERVTITIRASERRTSTVILRVLSRHHHLYATAST